MPPDQRNAYPNLILLCGDDHTFADKDHGIHYSVEQLHKMKADHEAIVDRRLSAMESESETRSRKRQGTLLEAASASRGRLVAQWLAVGVGVELAQALADDEAAGAPTRLGQTLPSTGLLVLEGDFGSGKSVTAERIYEADNATAMENDSAPLPLWLAAKFVTGPLIDAVRTALKGLGNINRNGVRLVLDGIDEPGLGRALELLNEARALPQVRLSEPSTPAAVRSQPSSDANISTAARPGRADRHTIG